MSPMSTSISSSRPMRSFYPRLVDAVSPVLIHLHSQEGLSLCLAPNSIRVLHLHKTNPLLTGQATERPPHALLNAPALSLTLPFVFHFTLFQAIYLVLFSWGKEKGCVFGKRGNVIGSLTNSMAKKALEITQASAFGVPLSLSPNE